MSDKPLEGQVALVTGAAKRIGRSIALRLANDGAAVAVNYNTSEAEADAVVREIESVDCRAVAIQADVSRRPEVGKMMAIVEREFGPLDILVNNAGVFSPGRFEDLPTKHGD